MSPDPAVALVLRFALALLLAAAGLAKLRDATGFAQALAGYRLLPERALGAAARTLPLCELALAAALVVGAPGAGPGAAVLFALYAGAIGWNLARGRRHIDCGCGGPGGRRPIHPSLVLRNLVLVAAGLAVGLPITERPLVALDVWTVGACLATLSLLWAASDVALANRARLGALGGAA